MDKQTENQVTENVQDAASVKAMKRGTVIQAVKAIAVLVCICLVCGALLALCNDIFFISDAERAARAEAKINASLAEVYPDLEDPQTIAINKEFQTNANFGTVTKVVRSKDGTYILAVVGVGGYKNGITANGLAGSITVLVVVNQQAKIVAWKISDGGQETQLNNIPSDATTKWYVGQEVSTDIEFVKVSGTTYSTRALNNAIKMASYYCMNVLNLGENPEADARNAIADLLASDDKYAAYVDYAWDVSLDTDYRNDSAVTYKANNQDVTATLSYYFVGTKAESQDLAAYVFKVGEELQVVITNENVNHANRAVIAVSADEEGNVIVNEAVVNSVLNRSYLEYNLQKIYKDFVLASVNDKVNFSAANGGVSKIYTSTDGVRIFEATGNGDFGTGSGDGVVTINVAVSADNKVLGWSAISTTTPGGNAYLFSKVVPDENSKNWYRNDTVTSSIEMGNNKTSGATMSSTAVNHAMQSVGAYLEQGGSN